MDEVDATSNVGSIGSSRRWRLCGNECPKAEIFFLCQVVILCPVIVVSIYNLTQGRTILGFRDNPLIGPNDGTDIVREADSVVDMSRGFESLYVYTNVVEACEFQRSASRMWTVLWGTCCLC